VLVQSRAFVSAVQAARVPDDRIEYVPNWAESLYEPRVVPPDAPERGELPEGFRVVVAGNLGIAQSVETIVAAADKLRDLADLRWVMIGEGSRRQWLRDEVAARGLDSSFCFIDRRPVEAMPTYFALADVLLVTLARDPAYAATVPSRLQSYLACGRPVIAALEGEGATVVEQSDAGLVCAPEDPEALAGAVLAMHGSNRDERAAMGIRARAYYEENFERDMLIDRISAALDEVVTNRP
jgi:colanic acid biosynthesis glycosyl transferase WcaI